jgi:hypothetical protein
MAPSRKPGPECISTSLWWPFDTGTLCRQQTPIPGTIGPHKEASTRDHRVVAEDEPWSGSIPAALGAPSIVRIPVPGTGGLAVELNPRGWIPKGGSTSTLWIQDISGKRHLRLDYGYNKTNGNTEWHWNQKGTFDEFGIKNHTPAGSSAEALGRSAKYFKWGGRILLVVAVAADGYSIVTSSNPLRRSVQVVSAWTLGWGGCKGVGAVGAAIGTGIEPGLGTAIGGLLGCAVGGFIGYKAGEATAGYLYDWAEDTVFTELPPEKKPPVEKNPSDLKTLPHDPREHRYLEQL